MKRKSANKFPRYQYWSAKKEECDIDIPKPIANQQPPVQAVQPLQYPRHQYIIEDPRLTLPPLQFMTRDTQENQPQKPIDENIQTNYPDAAKR